MAVVGIDDDPDRVITLARHLETDGQGADPDDARGEQAARFTIEPARAR